MLDRINNNFSLKNGGYSNYEGTTELPRHRWYYYKEGFSPSLVEKAIEQTKITENDIIIDPFNGSGTTTLTSSLNGHKSIGIEVNPFTSFLSETKIKNANSAELNTWKDRLLQFSENAFASPLLGYSTFSRTKDRDKWLFNDSILNSFESGWQLTYSIPSYNIRRLSRLALISAAMQNCNATRDGKCLRYRENWDQNNYSKESFVNSLQLIFSEIISDIKEKPITQKPLILRGDSREILKSDSIKNFKLCITSPPYLNTFDYTDIYRPELYLGKFIVGKKPLRNLRLKTVRSHIQVKWNVPELSDFGSLYENAIKHLKENEKNLMHKNIPLMIQAYFEDMLNILRLLKAKASKDAQIWLVVSNSAYAGLEIPVDLIIGDIGSKAGWYLKEIGVLRYVRKRKTKHSPTIDHLRESVVIFSTNKV